MRAKRLEAENLWQNLRTATQISENKIPCERLALFLGVIKQRTSTAPRLNYIESTRISWCGAITKSENDE